MVFPSWKPDALFLTGVSIFAPWFAALLVTVHRRHLRAIACIAALISIAASTLLLREASEGKSLYLALMLLFSCLTLGASLLLPRRDCTAGTMSGILFLLGSTLLAYSTDNLLILLAACVLSIVPFLLAGWLRPRAWRPLVALLFSTLALALAIDLISTGSGRFTIADLKGQSPGGVAAFSLLVIAVVFRKGICPAHAWVPDVADSGAAIPSSLLVNGHFGALLVAKLIVPLFPRIDSQVPVLSYLAIATALYVAIRALGENSPRRLIALLALSQSACILSGLESRTAEGTVGALVHWFVVSVSTVALSGILRLLEVRFGENLSASQHLGLAAHAPRLAVSFAVFGLALVGLPGTLGFCSQDLLVHGALMSHPLIGLLLPIAIAMNAISMFRLFTRLFLGKRRTGLTVMADALPRERWILAAGIAFVVLGGLFPNLIVAGRSREVDAVEQATLRPASAAGHAKDNLNLGGRPGLSGIGSSN